MKRIFPLLLGGLLLAVPLQGQEKPLPALYGTGTWNADSLGNHRIVVSVDKPSDAVLAVIQWRRRDFNPENKDLIVIDAKTGKRITNVCRFQINREKGEVAFQPQTVPGDYYIYYLKNISSGSKYYPTVTYPGFEETASAEWKKANRLTGKKAPELPQATVKQFQAINEFHSFYPMEVIATAKEKDDLLKSQPEDPYILFTEDRRYPIRMTTDLPYKWIEDNRHDSFEGTADKGEYYTFQIGLWAARKDVNHLKLTYSALVNSQTGESIPASAFTCFNTGGVDVTGSVFEKDCSVPKGKVQALWVGTMVPEQLTAGQYTGTVTVQAAGMKPKQVKVTLNVTDNLIANHGDNEPWRHSRLRWLNSQIGFDDEVIAPYIPLNVQDKTISLLGRKVTLQPNGFPAQITSYFKETLTEIGTEGLDILSRPMELTTGENWENLDFTYTKRKAGTLGWHATNQNNQFIMNLDAQIESDGNMEYKVVLIARKDGEINDIALRTELAPNIAQYMMGLGEKGGYCPQNLDWKWGVEKNQDALWTGSVNGGLQLRFYDDKYERPLNTNFYHEKPLHMPVSWCNNSNGGIKLSAAGKNTLINAYSGKRTVKKGDRLCFYFNVLITPFRTINPDKQWQDRYYHGYDFIDKTHEFGATVVNIHHANAINPFINYPFLRTREMKAYIDGAHAKNMKVKIYNTVRELSNSCTEIFALRSLNGEIFSKGKGGGYSWLQEHYDQDYIAAWFAYNVQDAAIVNTGVSRWHNYYMEGLDWLVKNVGIDGLYIDDLAFDRMSMKRVRKILNRTNPGAMIDLHSANQFNDKDGFANSANLYLEHFPYLDRLWFGEYFDYDMPPEFWMVEVSGIPYGLMGEMLWEGGNKWRGMLYGMTGRNPGYGVDNRPLWKFWDEFGMKGSEMIGYWVKDNPVKTGREKTLATIYRKTGTKTLVSLATWEDHDVDVTLQIDWAKLGLDPAKVSLHAPAIENFQPEKTWKPGDTVTVPKGKGWLIVIE
mgnify:FL=1